MNTLVQIKINKQLRDKKIGDIFWVNLKKPEGKYWARRLKEAKIDGCCEIVSVEPKQKSEAKPDMIQSESNETNKKSRNNKVSKGE